MHHVNHVESFWRLFKKSVASTHTHISLKYMRRYLDVFTFRSNHRQMENAMFDLLIGGGLITVARAASYSSLLASSA